MHEVLYSNIEREMEVYGYNSVVKSHCRMCHGGCGVIVYVKDGKVAKIAGDPELHKYIKPATQCYLSV